MQNFVAFSEYMNIKSRFVEGQTFVGLSYDGTAMEGKLMFLALDQKNDLMLPLQEP